MSPLTHPDGVSDRSYGSMIRRKEKVQLLRQSTNESSGTELHHHGTRSVGGGVLLQEVQTLSSQLQGNISYGSRLFEIPCEQTGFVRTDC
jgi:hypothetical protein